MARVCVTGATGFLGKYVVELLTEKGYQVHAFGRNAVRGRELENDHVKFIKGNLESLSDVSKAVRGCAFVVHAGALSSVWGAKKDFYSANVKGTINVLKACEKYKIKRMVFVSSPSIYTRNRDQLFINESQVAWNSQLNDYIKTKILAEKAIRKFDTSTFEKVIIRPRGLFGIGDTSIIPRLMHANKKIGIPIFNNGENLVDITCVENVAYSIWLALTAEGINGAVYNITNGEPMAFKKILYMFLDEIGLEPRFLKLNYPFMVKAAGCMEWFYKKMNIRKEPIFTRYTLMTLGFSQTLNIQKAKKELGYEPVYSIQEGIKKYAKWYRDQDFKR